MTTVFISSTYLDNRERRKQVADAIQRLRMVPVGMERLAASHDSIVEVSEREARECDVYVAIVAHRYGSIDDKRKKSITELEYEAAKDAGRNAVRIALR